jgi:hypothetical protein
MALAAAAQDMDKRESLRRLYKLQTTAAIEQFREQLIRRLRHEAGNSDAHTAVMSSELCSSRLINRSEITFLHTVLSPIFSTITLVLYIKRQDDALLSNYSTEVKHGLLETFALPDAAHIARKYDYLAMLRRWSTVFGRENIVCRRYHREFMINGDVVDDFCASIGIPGAPATPEFRRPPRLNQSLDADACELLRRLNSYVPRFTADGENLARGDIGAVLAQVSRGPFLGLTEEQQSALMRAVEQSNAEVADEFFGGRLPPPGDPLFGRATTARDRVQQPDLTIEKALELFAQVWLKKHEQVLELQRRVAGMKQRTELRRASGNAGG